MSKPNPISQEFLEDGQRVCSFVGDMFKTDGYIVPTLLLVFELDPELVKKHSEENGAKPEQALAMHPESMAMCKTVQQREIVAHIAALKMLGTLYDEEDGTTRDVRRVKSVWMVSEAWMARAYKGSDAYKSLEESRKKDGAMLSEKDMPRNNVNKIEIVIVAGSDDKGSQLFSREIINQWDMNEGKMVKFLKSHIGETSLSMSADVVETPILDKFYVTFNKGVETNEGFKLLPENNRGEFRKAFIRAVRKSIDTAKEQLIKLVESN